MERWDADRVLTQSSAEVLTAWLTEGDNYKRWKRTSQNGPETRADLCEEINSRLRAQRIEHRSSNAIARKILSFKQSVDKTSQFLTESGLSGGSVDQCGRHLRAEVLRLCPAFALLAPVMGSPTLRRSSHHQATAALSGLSDREKQDEAHKFDFFPSQSEDESEGADPEEEPALAKLSTRSKSIESRTEWVSKRQSVSWDMDHVRGKCSMDILVQWITNGSNYQRWKRSEGRTRPGTREKICVEINKLLADHGISYRSIEATRKKIVSLESSVQRAQKVLAQHGLLGLTTLSSCKKHVKKAIHQICPQFEVLASVMTADSRPQNEYESSEPPPATASRGKRRLINEVDHDIQSTRDGSEAQIKAEPAELKTLYGLEMQIQEARFELEREKRKLELDAIRRRMQLELCAAEEKQESALVVERALARQKLLDAGVSTEEVNVLLPSKRLRT